jgi:heat shock protein HslJ
MDRSLNLNKATTFIFFLSIVLSACGTEQTPAGSGDQAKLVTQADLQHHRWVLESINGNKIEAAKLANRIPELEIGEQMMASGHSGCNRFHGKAALREDRFIIDPVATTKMFCQPAQNDIEMLLLRVFGQESRISIDADKNLILETDDTLLLFRLQDWVE